MMRAGRVAPVPASRPHRRGRGKVYLQKRRGPGVKKRSLGNRKVSYEETVHQEKKKRHGVKRVPKRGGPTFLCRIPLIEGLVTGPKKKS